MLWIIKMGCLTFLDAASVRRASKVIFFNSLDIPVAFLCCLETKERNTYFNHWNVFFQTAYVVNNINSASADYNLEETSPVTAEVSNNNLAILTVNLLADPDLEETECFEITLQGTPSVGSLSECNIVTTICIKDVDIAGE